MATLATPLDFGNTIRQRRKALGWDQARLAHEIGVSRQWVIDMEKGKPRAELHLVLRALKALDLRLSLDGSQTRPAGDAPARPDFIDTIASRPAPHRLVTTMLAHRSSAKSDRSLFVADRNTIATVARRAARQLAEQSASDSGKAPPATKGQGKKTVKAGKISLRSSGGSGRTGKKPR